MSLFEGAAGMSIGKRLIDLARAELNSLLDKAARGRTTMTTTGDRRRRDGAEYAVDVRRELDEEIERRRQAREEVEQAASGGDTRPPRVAAAHASSAPPRRTAAGDDAIRKAYAALEVPAGSDFETVRAFVPAADAQVPPRPQRGLAGEAARGHRSLAAADRGVQDARAAPAPLDARRDWPAQLTDRAPKTGACLDMPAMVRLVVLSSLVLLNACTPGPVTARASAGDSMTGAGSAGGSGRPGERARRRGAPTDAAAGARGSDGAGGQYGRRRRDVAIAGRTGSSACRDAQAAGARCAADRAGGG